MTSNHDKMFTSLIVKGMQRKKLDIFINVREFFFKIIIQAAQVFVKWAPYILLGVRGLNLCNPFRNQLGNILQHLTKISKNVYFLNIHLAWYLYFGAFVLRK